MYLTMIVLGFDHFHVAIFPGSLGKGIKIHILIYAPYGYMHHYCDSRI
jgi:hypothetical protein